MQMAVARHGDATATHIDSTTDSINLHIIGDVVDTCELVTTSNIAGLYMVRLPITFNVQQSVDLCIECANVCTDGNVTYCDQCQWIVVCADCKASRDNMSHECHIYSTVRSGQRFDEC